MSAGNHAQAVARHAALAGIPAMIVMPRFTPATKVVRTEGWGARVVLHGETLAEAAAHAHELARRDGLVFIHPYDDPAVIAGQGTMALEMLEDAPELDALVLPVGGGGLLAGCAAAARALAAGHAGVRRGGGGLPGHGAAPRRGARFRSAGRPSPRASRCATSARCRSRMIREFGIEVLVVPERAVEAGHRPAGRGRAGGGGGRRRGGPRRHPGLSGALRRQGRVGTAVCGGNIDSRILSNVLLRNLLRDGRILRLHLDIPDRPGVLADIAARVAAAGGNIIEVLHQRLFAAPSVQSAELELMVEVRDASQGEALVAALEAGGYAVRRG